ncbi:circularly permuted type 2 ATP-grasp protein [Marinobacter salinexigens]|uniref:Circularly permuted type 2 ATP-grasp protein n=1 Tax=Marinobacter salinexigens TaxID=2919747 RepID=A0A5B0VBC4_9GAMM|nr:circularly permuted type 2 ATP-grasp protein [Marinobacter salinexigens]
MPDVDPKIQYQPWEGRFDEACQKSGEIRPHWEYVLNALTQLGPAGLLDRQQKAQRILRDDGANYNQVGEKSKSREWQLDPVPMLIDSEDWSRIESGLSERAELFDLILRDLYGPQELIRNRILPPELILSHSSFLRVCHGLSVPGEQQLILHAVDMVRGPDGTIQVVADRTQAPSGAGYALENRLVMSRILPSLIRDSQAHRLALFFQALRRKLNNLSPNGGTPRVVILTPGAYSETYFEHTYLANYLGYSLVQGGDLTVRDGYVWLKSLDGLHRVDVILRRVDDTWCDPVELRGDSHLGVPGLLEVVRAGNVAVANPLGSGVLENPALHKYMPQVSHFFLGRELSLPSVHTWWLGDPDDRKYVFANLDNLIIKSTHRRAGEHSIYTGDLNDEQRSQVRAKLARNPERWAAQIANLPSTAPAWNRNKSNLQPRPTVIRGFAVADDSSYTVMSGGLTRVASSSKQTVVSNQLGASSKDTWVLASEPQRYTTLRDQQTTSLTGELSSDLPSRVVENLFWMGRYSERAESSTRLLRTTFMQLSAVNSLPEGVRRQLLWSVTAVTGSYPGFNSENKETVADPEPELLAIILDSKRFGSVSSNLHAMLNCTEEAREMLSGDTHRVLSDLRDTLDDLPQQLRPGSLSAPEEALDPLITSLLALSGLTQESMIRGFGWRFLEMGRRLERTLQSILLLRALLVPVLSEDEEEQVLEASLMCGEVLVTYRRRYRSQPELRNTLILLLLDRTNPRSLQYQLDQLTQHLSELQDAGDSTSSSILSEERRRLLEARTLLRLCRPEQLAELDKDGQRSALDQLLGKLFTLMNDTATLIAGHYFEHKSNPQQLVNTRWSDYE